MKYDELYFVSRAHVRYRRLGQKRTRQSQPIAHIHSRYSSQYYNLETAEGYCRITYTPVCRRKFIIYMEPGGFSRA